MEPIAAVTAIVAALFGVLSVAFGLLWCFVTFLVW